MLCPGLEPLAGTELMLCAGLEQETVQLRQLLEAERAHVQDLESSNLELTQALNCKAEQQLMMGKQVIAAAPRALGCALRVGTVRCVLYVVRPVLFAVRCVLCTVRRVWVLCALCLLSVGCWLFVLRITYSLNTVCCADGVYVS